MKKTVSLLVCLALILALGAPALAESKEYEPAVIKMLVPENSPTSLPFQMADLVSGAVQNPVWDVFKSMLDAKNLTIEFELVARSQYSVVAQTRLASALDLPDVLNVQFLQSAQLMSYANLGILLPISDIIAEHCSPETIEIINTKYPFYYGATANPADGKSYTYGHIDAYTIDGEFGSFTITLKIRYDWLEKCGLDMPETVYDLIDIGKAFQEQDANGNGVIGDEVFDGNATNFHYFGDFFGLVPNVTGVINDGNNTVVSPWYQEGVKDYFEFMRDLYAEGLLDMTVGATQLNAEDRLIGNYQYAYQEHLEQASANPNCFYAPVTLLTAIDGIEPVARMDQTQLYGGETKFAVTNACKNTEPIGRLLDILFSPEYEELTMAGIEGLTYTLIEGNGDRPVMNTNIAFIVPDGNVDKMRETGLCKGYRLWGKGIFPRITTVEVKKSFIEKQIADFEAAGDFKNAFRYKMQLESYDYPLTVFYRTDDSYAMPSDAEAERKNEIRTDITTYADELYTNLVTGVASLDDWDKYIADLKDLGLDELIEIDQALADRKAGK